MNRGRRNKVLTIPLPSLSATQKLAEAIARHVTPGFSLGLSGPLGAGKTAFVRALCQSLGVIDEVTSPTFVLEAVYRLPGTGGRVHHWDLYRLSAGVADLELFDQLRDREDVVLVEWCERSPALDDLLCGHLTLAFAESCAGVTKPESSAKSGDNAGRVAMLSQFRDPNIMTALQHSF